jgi:hypothetical protein
MHIEGYKIHRLAQKAPEMTASEYRELKKSIQQMGQTHAIIQYQDEILEGRHRLKVCLELGIEPRIEQYTGTQTVAQYIFSTNIRRNLTQTQRHQYIADFAPIIIPEIEKETKESQKSKVGRTQFVGENPPRRTASDHSGRKYAMEKLGATEWEIRSAKEIMAHAPELLGEVGKIGSLGKAATEAKKRSGGKKKSSKKKEPTAAEIRQRRNEILNNLGPLPVLTRDQVDPDFKGTPQEWVDKYGHLLIQTKAQMEAEADRQAFSNWVAAFRDLKKPLTAYLKIGSFSIENYHKFIAKAGSEERRTRRVGEIKELVDMVIRIRESIEWLITELERGKIIL